MKNRKLLSIAVLVVLVTSISSISAFSSTNTSVKDKISNLTEDFNTKKSELEKSGTYDTNTKEAKDVKALGIQIADLSETVKTEADYRKELEDALYWSKKGLEDSKEEQKSCNNDTERQKSIDKIEKKLNNIETQMKSLKKNSGTKSIQQNSDDNNNSYKELLKELNTPNE